MKTGILKTLSGDTKYVSRKESRGYIFRNVNNGNDFNGYWSTEERLIQDAKRNGLKIINNQ